MKIISHWLDWVSGWESPEYRSAIKKLTNHSKENGFSDGFTLLCAIYIEKQYTHKMLYRCVLYTKISNKCIGRPNELK